MSYEIVALQGDMNKVKQTLWEGDSSLVIRMTKVEMSQAMLTKIAWLLLSSSVISLCTVLSEILLHRHP